ncbi:MAG: leucine-rich repeat domain-containing protein, partial [Treponema sp.]|nr:leucine-rich repeat domain-containing protein [Treponema sp.]
GCENLKSISLLGDLAHIGERAFSECCSLISINVDSDNKYYADRNGVLFTKDFTTLVTYPAGKKTSTYNIPRGVTYIGAYAFESCNSLSSITMPDGITRIGDYAFTGCSLSSVIIPKSVTDIGESIFAYCLNIKSVTIPESINRIPNKAFFRCHALKSISLQAITPAKLGRDVFAYTNAYIYVPPAALASYRNAPGWRDYADMIKAMDG